MCGRFTLALSPEELAQLMALDAALDLELGLHPRFNIAPGQDIVAAVQETPDGPREARAFRWGLVPSWAEDPAIGNRLINARAETAPAKPSFRDAYRRRRCLVPADGFYEWQRHGGRKQPWLFRVIDEPGFCMAGLWETWSPPGVEPLHTCTLLTTAANALLRPVHERMPVILNRDDYERWLTAQPDAAAGLRDLLRPFPAEAMTAWPVSPQVNNPRHDVPECVESVAPAATTPEEIGDEPGGQMSLL